MINDNYFITTIDEIRKDKNMTVSALVDGIVTERTYRRYLRFETKVRYSILEKLADKLNIILGDIIFYVLHVKLKKSHINDFLKAYHSHDKELSFKYYKRVLEEVDEEEDFVRYMDALTKRYECESDIISKNQYIETLNKHYEYFKEKDIKKVFTISFLTLYFIENKDNELFTAEVMYDALIANEYYKKRILLFFTSADLFLRSVINTKHYDNDKHKKLADVCHYASHTFGNVQYLNDAAFHTAVANYKLGNKDLFEERLFRYLMGKILIRHENDFDQEYKYLNQLFDLDIVEFQINYAKLFLSGKSKSTNSEIG